METMTTSGSKTVLTPQCLKFKITSHFKAVIHNAAVYHGNVITIFVFSTRTLWYGLRKLNKNK